MQQSGRGMQEFGTKLINSPQLSHLIYYPNANDVFGDVSISDGISVVHKDYSKEANEFNYVLAENGSFIETKRKNPGEQTFIIYPIDESIVNKINKFVIDNNLDYLSSSSIINQKLFQIESNFVEMNPDKVELYTGQKIDKSTQIKLLANDKAGKAGRATWFVANRDVIKVHRELIDKYKVVVSSANAGGQKRDNQLTILEPYTAFGRSRLALKAFDTEVEAQNFYEYVNSYFIRFAFLLTDENLSSLAKLVPDLLDYSNSQKLIDFSNDIDKQLFDILDLTSEEIQRIKQRVESIRS
ncbi:Type II restriction endonuclease [Streptococcus infantarius subsp. infantarius]|nr:Type II restriction endonuclease [Streptococcus infantarius subsp. infantarius]